MCCSYRVEIFCSEARVLLTLGAGGCWGATHERVAAEFLGARPGWAGLGWAGPGRAGLGWAGLGWAG